MHMIRSRPAPQFVKPCQASADDGRRVARGRHDLLVADGDARLAVEHDPRLGVRMPVQVGPLRRGRCRRGSTRCRSRTGGPRTSACGRSRCGARRPARRPAVVASTGVVGSHGDGSFRFGMPRRHPLRTGSARGIRLGSISMWIESSWTSGWRPTTSRRSGSASRPGTSSAMRSACCSVRTTSRCSGGGCAACATDVPREAFELLARDHRRRRLLPRLPHGDAELGHGRPTTRCDGCAPCRPSCSGPTSRRCSRDRADRGTRRSPA